MSEPTPQGTIEQYVREFNLKTNNGDVLTADISDIIVGKTYLKTLTPREEKERREWAEKRPGLEGYYSVRRALDGLSPSEMLLLPVAPPSLVFEHNIATRTAKGKMETRAYLRAGVWADFEVGVQKFKVPAVAEETGRGVDVLFLSLQVDTWVTNETQEVGFIVNHVLQPLQKARLLVHGTRQIVESPKQSAPVPQDAAAPVPEDAAGPVPEDAAGPIPQAAAAPVPEAAAAPVPQDAGAPVPEAAAAPVPQDAGAPVPEDAAGQRLSFADHFLMAGVTAEGKEKLVPIEFKATQNLLFPNSAEVLVERYNRMNPRDSQWIKIAHRLSQLMYYMVSGGSLYGVLTSGTRSYFCKVELTADGIPSRVLITRAWFIGQPNFLRAWAYLFDLAKGDGYFEPNLALLESLKYPGDDNDEGKAGRDPDQPGDNADGDDDVADDKADDREDDMEDKRAPKRPKSGDQAHGAGGPSSEHEMAWLDPGLAPSIPRVDGEEIQMTRVLAYGNHADVYHARWKGKEVAVKVFDYFKGLQQFKSEIRAYEHLKDAWGVLVPEPYFIADWRGLLALGIQLGRDPNSIDMTFYSDLHDLFCTLRRDYAFAHLDEEPRNSIYIPDKSGKGKDRLVAIDLELHKILG